MRSISLESATLDTCIREAQRERIITTREGAPVALLIGIEEMDEEQVEFGIDDEFWRMIGKRRQQRTLSRAEIERVATE